MYQTNNGLSQRVNNDQAIYRNRENGRFHPNRRYHEGDHLLNPVSLKQQLRESWLIVIIGFILFTVGMCLLVWNEGRAVKVAHSLDEALNNVVVVENPSKLLTEYEGRLVYVSGPLSVGEPLTEPDYGVMVTSVKLKRRAQMYQWIEIEDERSFSPVSEEDKHYYYTLEWRDKLIDSDSFYIRFGHENPKEMPVTSRTQIADEVNIGAYELGMELKKKFNEFIEVTSDERPERRDIRMHSGLYYHGDDLWNPVVGDIRVQMSYAGHAGDIYTVVGKLENGSLEPYTTSHGEQISLQRKYKIEVNEMFHLEHVNNYWRTWGIRGVGWLVVFLSATCLANILRTIILNSSLLCGIIAIDSLTLSVSMSISLLVIGFAWVWYRPIIGVCLALASFLPFLYTILGSGSSDSTTSNQQQENYRRL